MQDSYIQQLQRLGYLQARNLRKVTKLTSNYGFPSYCYLLSTLDHSLPKGLFSSTQDVLSLT